MLTDYFDGMIARKLNAESSFGSFLDPLADKFLVLSGFFVLLTRPDLEWNVWKIWVFVSVTLIALREVAVTVLRSQKAVSDTPLVTSIWGKAKTTVQMVTLIIGLILLNIKDMYSMELVYVLDVIAIGIIASAILALVSATDYFRTANS